MDSQVERRKQVVPTESTHIYVYFNIHILLNHLNVANLLECNDLNQSVLLYHNICMLQQVQYSIVQYQHIHSQHID